MPRGQASRARIQDGDADKKMWLKMLGEERTEITNLRARIKELEAGARVTAIAKKPIPTRCDKVCKAA